MCGIAGLIKFSGEAVSKKVITRMTDSIAHRGPDGEGIFVEGNVGLGHRRLSIIDLSDNAAQPMVCGDYAIAYNGEVYNYKEVRRELENKGHHFFSNSDTGVVLKAYIEWKEHCVLKFNGMFSFCV